MILDRTIAPAITNTVDIPLQLKPYSFFELDNNVPVYAIEAGAQDVVMLELVFDAGNWYEEKNIIAASTNFLLKNGTSNKNAFAINESFDHYGAYLNRNCYNETATITLHCLSKYLHQVLPFITELINDSIFPEKEIDIYKRNQKLKLEVNLKKCDFVANRLIDEYVYGINHPYGKYTSTIAYDAITRDDIINHYNNYYKKGNCKIFIAGKLPHNYQSQINEAFGKLELNNNVTIQKNHLQTPALQKKYHLINDEKGVQASIRMALPFPNRKHPDFVKTQVLNNIFGGFFGSRLMENIREDKGYTYGIHSYLQNHMSNTAWMISTEAGRDVAQATIDEVYKEMAILQNELIDDEELSLVRNYMIGGLLGDLDGPFQIIGRWKSYILNGLDENYFKQAVETIKTVTAEELQELAKKYLNKDNFYELMVI
ncbi:MAG: M16 family metallopeptidase [Chitinophagaceae bacterium]